MSSPKERAAEIRKRIHQVHYRGGKDLEWNGIKLKVTAPSIGKAFAWESMEDRGVAVMEILRECVYDAETGEAIYADATEEELMAVPAELAGLIGSTVGEIAEGASGNSHSTAPE